MLYSTRRINCSAAADNAIHVFGRVRGVTRTPPHVPFRNGKCNPRYLDAHNSARRRHSPPPKTKAARRGAQERRGEE